MTESVADPAQQAASTNTPTSERRPIWRHPEIEVLGLALVMAIISLVVMLVVPDRGDAVRPGGWWAFITVVALFGAIGGSRKAIDASLLSSAYSV